MKEFLHAHAAHPDWRMALALAAAQVEAQRGQGGKVAQPTLGWLYLTDPYAPVAGALLEAVQQRWPGVAWVGGVGRGVLASGAEYIDEPALALMLSDLAPSQFRVFSGLRPLPAAPRGTEFSAATALVHADPHTADVDELIVELAERTGTGYLFGGLVNARDDAACLQLADGVFTGGLSGVAFGPEVPLLSRVSQGCQPVGPAREITQADHNLVFTLDGESALDCLLGDLGLPSMEQRDALWQLRHTMAGLTLPGDDAFAHPGAFGTDTRVRELIGFEPLRRGVAVGEDVQLGMRLTFCNRDTAAARRDLVRICAEIREELDAQAQAIAGAVYVSCAGRGGPHFGAPNAEMAIVQHALGDVPLVGFFAAGEIARGHLYGYTGVLTVWCRPLPMPAE
jgi:small ligand-binding sensory domain FIST